MVNTSEKYLVLLSNCTKLSVNNVQIDYKYAANKVKLFGQLVILHCKKNLFNKAAAHAILLYPLCFCHLMRHEQKDLAGKKSRWIINNLLDVLVCIADYFYL